MHHLNFPNHTFVTFTVGWFIFVIILIIII